MQPLLDYLGHFWDVTVAMAPYLLLGFLVAGLLSGWLTQGFVQRHLGRSRWSAIFRATLVGVPMPLCSCGVLPVAAAFRDRGASRGATASFLTATPQTGVDSIAATYALLGPVFTLVRVVAAFLTGWINGFLVEWLGGKPAAGARTTAGANAGCCDSASEDGSAGGDGEDGCCHQNPDTSGSLKAMLTYGLITMPREIGRALLVGLLLAALIVQVVPENQLASVAGGGFMSLVLITALSVPLYVCSTGSIPLGLALLHAGVSPGAVLVFLIAGPATNTATFTTLWAMIGRRATIVYITGLILSAWTVGWVFNLLYAGTLDTARHAHESVLPAWLGNASAVVLLGLLACVLLPQLRHLWPGSAKASGEA